MLNTRTSAYLRDNYNELSDFCRSRMEPVFITRDGQEDLAVMNIEAYRKNHARYELYSLIDQGLKELENGEGTDFDEFMEEFWKETE
ncbi:MAG: hypothetical protein FWH07_07730 [Oscillospiraceae bacterium]|nr:hypothetical protein [Oscillospiraceae bacterium]